jgi:hypothetical protein
MLERIKAEVRRGYEGAGAREEITYFQEVNLVELIGIASSENRQVIEPS